MRAVGTKIVHHSFGKAIWVMRFHTDAALRVPVQKFWPRLAFMYMIYIDIHDTSWHILELHGIGLDFVWR